MATLKDIKLRISSVKNTQQITKAMKMVAASKMKKAEDRIKAARPYTDKLTQVVTNLASGLEAGAHPLLTKRKGGKALIVLFTSDRGLCGGLNSNLCKSLNRFIKSVLEEVEHVELVTLGRKGRDYFRKTNEKMLQSFADRKENEYTEELGKLMSQLIAGYEEGEFNRLYLAYNHFRNVITQEVTFQQVLPVQPPKGGGPAVEAEFVLEPDKAAILNEILPQYVENQAFTALLDGFACEHASRMTSMDAATKNAGELIKSLRLQYNRARQAAITTELTEIISGAESL
ncbi:MAG: ATP synthase F1 subunit gamma [Candidatus Lambdaproteobacteria bacterium RIFOXYD2_FULL_50_16]|uniref:ATP synthase gamma chain n=1 Tax=Candidatus Lambdaproteobacteria bacterium RIFOXYD2_FULL_50_16 TaxID=1817772 RepID=A0A1F6GEE8_9PROT|nr:MAG: ATP synthase F1 subunit gamma [Candidatus Lambdaproteobacteria bacterium RIFOXYD2_FULL_50_16]